jgi:hypothetical protein
VDLADKPPQVVHTDAVWDGDWRAASNCHLNFEPGRTLPLNGMKYVPLAAGVKKASH